MIQLRSITLATYTMQAMCVFYEVLLEVPATPVIIEAGTIYTYSLEGLDLVLCPASIAGVGASQNRHQLEFYIPGRLPILKKLLAVGGTLMNGADPDPKATSVALYDPDRNSLVVHF